MTQPFEGAKKEGVAGLIKGFGKGIGGVVLKPSAGEQPVESFSKLLLTVYLAIWGLPGYTFKGIYKELQNHLGSSVQNYIVAARTAQGYEDLHNSNQQERLDVVSRWQAIQVEIEKEKQNARHGRFHGHHCYLKATIEERKRHSAEKKKDKKSTRGKPIDQTRVPAPSPHPFVRQTSESSSPEQDGFEEAIKASVAATSHGNPEEDEMIEKAIRASVRELHLASKEGDDRDAIQRAIQASVAEAVRARGKDVSKPNADGLDGIIDHDKELEAALHRSLTETRSNVVTIDFDDSGIDTDDDENIKLAMERSRSEGTGGLQAADIDDEDLQEAIKISQDDHEEHKQSLSKSKTEEDIVLEYVKKQSLAEEQYKKSVAAKYDEDPSDEDMKKATEQSLNLQS